MEKQADMITKRTLILLMWVLLTCSIAHADPGETDADGGHYNRITGEYHLHVVKAPSLTPTQQDIIAIQKLALADASRHAKRDAEANRTWYGAGVLFGVLGIGAAYVITPDIPPASLLGKSPEYIVFYTTEYQKVRRTEQVEQATTGCVIWGVAVVGYYMYSTGQL